jgi:hypothetical protein
MSFVCEARAASGAAVENLAPQLRGGLGRVLKQRLCRHEHADPCEPERAGAAPGCEYLRLFRPCRCVAGEGLAGSPLGNEHNLPAPFVISPAWGAARDARAVGAFSFDFVSLGELCDLHWYPVAAFESFGEDGLARADGTRAPFRLVSVCDQLAGGRLLFAGDRLSPPAVRDIREAVAGWLPAAAPTALQVNFTTPVSVRWARARRQDPDTGLTLFLDFYDLARAVAERVANLRQLYGDDWLGQPEYYRWRNRLLTAAREVRTLHSSLRIERGERYSRAQDRSVSLSGFVGEMQFSGDFTPFLELLMIGEAIHIGRHTTSGLGRYALLF